MGTSFWATVERELGSSLTGGERAFLQVRERERSYGEADSDEERFEAVVDAVRDVQALRASSPGSRQLGGPLVTPDARWDLLADIADEWDRYSQEQVGEAVREGAAGTFLFHDLPTSAATRLRWQPLRVTGLEPDPYTPIAPRWVEIRFDSRLSLARLIEAIRRAWPELGRKGFVRRTRPQGARAIALIRFVCLEAPSDSSWRARWSAWGARYPKWAFPNVRRFQATFRRAEEQLTGRQRGLEWFYDPLARLTLEELSQLSNTDHREARKRVRALANEAAALSTTPPEAIAPIGFRSQAATREREAKLQSYSFPRLMNNFTATARWDTLGKIRESVHRSAEAGDEKMRAHLRELLRPEYEQIVLTSGLEVPPEWIEKRLAQRAEEIMSSRFGAESRDLGSTVE